MLWRIFRLILALAGAALIVTLAVANKHTVPLILDPVSDKPILFIERRLFEYLLATLILGVVLGGFATWLTQSHWRRSARHRAQEAMRWQAEADRLARERDQTVASGGNSSSVGALASSGSKALAVAGRR